MGTAMVAINWIVGATLAAVTVWMYPDHSALAITRWVLLYLAAVAVPFWWYRKARRHFQASGVVESPELHAIAFRPILVGVLTLLMALPLIFAGR